MPACPGCRHGVSGGCYLDDAGESHFFEGKTQQLLGKGGDVKALREFGVVVVAVYAVKPD